MTSYIFLGKIQEQFEDAILREEWGERGGADFQSSFFSRLNHWTLTLRQSYSQFQLDPIGLSSRYGSLLFFVYWVHVATGHIEDFAQICHMCCCLCTSMVDKCSVCHQEILDFNSLLTAHLVVS